MKTKFKQQRGAVLVVALIMLSMVTFLVIAFVGFSRFERASVEASMVRTEAGHALEIGLVEAQQEITDMIKINLNHGLLVSQNHDGAGVFMNQLTNQQSLVNFVTSLTNSPRVPVFIDRSGDGVQDTFPFFLDLNAATNTVGSRYQGTMTNVFGRQILAGDPHWIGLLEYPGQRHGPKNKFVARYAYLTVPAHKALNIRYNHNNFKAPSNTSLLDLYGRLQGRHPRELNIAAPLSMLDPVYFPYNFLHPYLANPSSLSSPVPKLVGGSSLGYAPSAFGYAAVLNYFGHQIEDAMHLSRPSKGYKELRDQNPGLPAGHLSNLTHWLNSTDPVRPGVPMTTPEYSYYRFMELFSSTPLPAEPEKFDVNSIRDEIVEGTAYIDTHQPGLPSTFPGLSGLKFSEPHGLKSGDKLEWASSSSGPPMIYDPITFNVITDNMTDAQRQQRLEELTKGSVNTPVPHHLVGRDWVQINLTGIGGGQAWLKSVSSKGPYKPVQLPRVMKVYGETPNPMPFPTSELKELRLKTLNEIAGTVYNYCWGHWDKQNLIWLKDYEARPEMPNGDLPPEFKNARCALTYRAEPLRLDLIPYFVKVIDEKKVTLHRSAQLDEFSKVILCYPRSRFKHNSGVFTGVDKYAWLFRNGYSVRFVIPNNSNGSPGKIATASGATITGQDTFMLRKFGTVPSQFTLPDPADPSKPLKMKDGFTYTLQVVPKNPFHNFRHDGLSAAMEKMAGLMLNESLDTTGGSTAASHALGNQPLPRENDPADPMNPNPPFPLKMGIGGHQKSLGPWHHPNKGIPWGRGPASAFLQGSGRYTREMDRIVQVAANIADLYSEPPANISNRPTKIFGYPLFGKDLVQFDKDVKPQGMLRYGDIKSDCQISADIRQNSILTGGLSGLGLGEYFAYFKPDPATFKNPKVKGRVYLQIGTAGAHVAISKELELDVLGPIKGPVTWVWHLNKLVPRGGSGNPEYWVGYNFRMTCEAGLEVRVYFNNEEVLSYENSKRPNPGQASSLSVGADAVFTNLKPWVELGKQPGNAQCVDFQNKQPKWYVDAAPSLGWAHRRYASISSELPTAYKGVFRRDEWNNVYLTGFQRRKYILYNSDNNPGISWYQRFAPTVIGVKDRSNYARPLPGHNMHPSITEVALRVNFDRHSKKLYGRLGMEVYVPGVIGGPSRTYKISARAGIIGGKYVLERTDSKGGKHYVTTPLNIEKDYRPFTTSSSTGNPLSMLGMTISLVPGRHTIIFGPHPYKPAPGFNSKTGFFPLSTDNITLSDGTDSLTDIRIENLQLAFEGEIVASPSFRPVDYINDTFKINEPVRFANPSPLNQEWLFIPTWKAGKKYGQIGGQNHPEVVIDDAVNAVYRLQPGIVVGNAKDRPSSKPAKWFRLQKDLRKIEISWQTNDPLVNSHGSDFKINDYSPPYLFVNKKGRIVPKPSPNAKTYRSWMPNDAHNRPFAFPKLPHKASGFSWNLGVNLALKNDASEHWGKGIPDSSIKDPGVGLYTPQRPQLDWRFPDISRGPIKNVGWLGQVHRGTPWQTLYLKSKIPGSVRVASINDATGEAVTAAPHNFVNGEFVKMSGYKPATWINVVNVKDVDGSAQVTGPNTFILQGAAGNVLQGLDGNGAVYNTPGLLAVSSKWLRWAGSLDTMPANDRRLMEVFSVGTGAPVRGRFSVNNDLPQAWSAVLNGLSIPLRSTKIAGGSTQPQLRNVGANIYPGSDARIDLHDGLWGQVVAGINAVRGTNTFTRVTDVLAAPQLTDRSPYLQVAWQNVAVPGFQEELDLERIPMQLLSLLRVDDQPVCETYIFTEKLRPALRLKLSKYTGPAISSNGTILNYEVAGQAVRRVVYKLSGAKEWHRSIKNKHTGYWRDKDGNLQPLPPLRPIILHSSTLQMN